VDGLSGAALLDREAAIAAWRRAEAIVYPSVMVNAELYEQYIRVVRAIVDELRAIATEEDLVRVWREQRQLGAEALARLRPPLAPLIDAEAVRDAAFCQRHRETQRERAREIARERLERARRCGERWVLLFEDVTPFGSHRLEMHVRSGRAIHASARSEAGGGAVYELEVVQLDPRDGAWLIDAPPLLPTRTFSTREEWEVRIAQARKRFGEE